MLVKIFELLSFIFLAASFLTCFAPSFDSGMSQAIRSNHNAGFDVFMAFVSWWGMSAMMVIPVIIVAVIFCAALYRREAAFVLAVFAADALNVVLKLMIDRPRPEEVPIFPRFQAGSFPSGHVVHYVVFFGFLLVVMLVQRRIHSALRIAIVALCVVLIASVGVARVYLNAHWPTDILAAYAVGFMMLAVLVRNYLKGCRHPELAV